MGDGITMTVGLDLGDRHSHLCLLDADGQVVDQQRLVTSRDGLAGYFGDLVPSRVVLEASTGSRWIAAFLDDLGHEVIVANPRRVRLISGSAYKNDRRDAEFLARLGRVDPALLSPIRHRGDQAQGDLSLVRARANLVETRTKLVNCARALVKGAGHRLPACATESFHRKVREFIPRELRPAVAPLLSVIRSISGRIEALDRVIARRARERYPETQHLEQVGGVGPVTALTYVLTIDDPTRFDRSRDVGPFLGLSPRQDQSGNVDKQLGISKAGNGYLRKLLVQCAHYILGPFGRDSDLRRWGMSLAGRAGKNAKKRATVAVARKLAVLLHRLWITGDIYEPEYNST